MTIRAIVIAATFLAATLSSGASAEVINGCIKSNGTLKVVADLSQCSSREAPISWNVQGPKGDMGDPGMDGEPGPAGPSLRALDGAGNVLGLHASGLAGSGGTFLIEDLGLLVPYELARGDIHPREVYFNLPECGGPAFIGAQQPPIYANYLLGQFTLAPIPRFLVTGTEIQVGEQPHVSRYASNTCVAATGTLTKWLQAEPFAGTLPFTIPVPGPIHIGLPPE